MSINHVEFKKRKRQQKIEIDTIKLSQSISKQNIKCHIEKKRKSK